jgi:septal ring factor EnvC (AmiA/AmiB activator)
MVFYETFKHKFEVKKMESSKLLTRLEELSQVNGGLEDQIGKQKQKNYKLQREIEDLREKIKMLKSSNVGDSLAGYDLESHPMDMSYFKNT